jgi:sugar lactone lactonase YvrE
VLCYDLENGKLLRRIEGPRPSALGDLTLGTDGSVFVSDGEHGAIYRLEPGKDALERLDGGDFISPQTIVVAPDAAHLYVPDYVRGLGVLDLETKRVRWLPTAGRFALDGIDGLYRVGSHFIAVQNGTSPERVVRFSTDAAVTKVLAEQVIERATATLGDPTHGVVVGDTFYYLANSGWDALDADGSVKSGATMTDAVVMKWKMSAAP